MSCAYENATVFIKQNTSHDTEPQLQSWLFDTAHRGVLISEEACHHNIVT